MDIKQIALKILQPYAESLAPGLLGTGAMVQRVGETNEQYESRLKYAAGAAIMAGNLALKSSVNYSTTEKAVKAGAVRAVVTFWVCVVLAFLLCVLSIFLINKQK